ncbi:tetratricopeptide repeat protein [Phytoactinopolyspora limicola]|uniref:tetratricopeptide repeat protein n=1 Tax=Phytoactinopolyspora limicola TaxID=2715536 RepID=UPI0014084A36|nr:tetratricopeptide repeat protein [Phytoactinopolyspora limicola]
MTAPDTNFYELLDLDPEADPEAISVAIRRERKIWIRRQNAPDAQRRAEAELRVAELDDAEQTLLDVERRRDYDRRLDGQRRRRQGNDDGPPPPPEPVVDVEQLLATAEEYLDADLPRLAHEVATEATRADRRDERGWAYRGAASARLGDYEQAESEFREAVRLSPRSVRYLTQLMYAQLRLGWMDAARDTLARAEQEDPDDLDVRLAKAHFCLAVDRPDDAYAVVYGLAQIRPDDAVVHGVAAHALRDMTLARLSVPQPDYFVYTSRRQIDFAREHLQRALALRFDDDELRGDINRWLVLASEAEQRVWVRGGGVAGIGAFAVLMFVAISAGAAGVGGGATLFFLIAICVLGVWVARRWRPRWKVNRDAMRYRGGLRWGI